MCSILSLISFKSTERSVNKVFFHIWSVVLSIWPKNMLQTYFQHFFLAITDIILGIINYVAISFLSYKMKEIF